MADKTLETLHFDNLALRTLPLDTIEDNYVRTVRNACFSRVSPTPVDSPETVAYSTSAMALLDLSEKELRRKDFPKYFSGNQLLPGSETASHCYCGHQFGVFAGQLGDGAAIYLGEIINSKGERWELQLKGAGKTPYSRAADGRKVLRSSIREFLCSEAIHNLGIPTTRAGSCVTSKSRVTRDVFYDGHPVDEKATIVSRIAPSFIRFGSFEIFKTRDHMTGRHGPSVGQISILKTLVDYTVSTFYPEINRRFASNDTAKYRAFYKEVVLRTARLVAGWQCVGFCHGVLNTDNMSILGLTIDYGPFGFMDRYSPDHVCNASDDNARYTYSKQPEICLWNLVKLGEALEPVLPLDQSLTELQSYKAEFERCYLGQMRKKLGLFKQMAGDSELVEKFLDTMDDVGGDFTNSFRCLSELSLPRSKNHEASLEIVGEKLLSFSSTLEEQKLSLHDTMDDGQLKLLMMLYNTQPQLLEQAGKGKSVIDRELKKQEKIKNLLKMTAEEKLNFNRQKWDEWLLFYVDRLKLDVSEIANVERENEARVEMMNKNNPKYILRNYIAQSAISKAEKGDYSEVQRVLRILENPYDEGNEVSSSSPDDNLSYSSNNSAASTSHSCQCPHRQPTGWRAVINYASKPPEWAGGLRVT